MIECERWQESQPFLCCWPSVIARFTNTPARRSPVDHFESSWSMPGGGSRTGAADHVDVVVLGGGIAPQLDARRVRDIARGDTAIIAIGAETLISTAPMQTARQGEVILPADASPREIQLACQLLGENVRLRRRIRTEHRTRRRLSQLAMTDPLTGVANRRAWEREILVRSRPAANRAGGQCLAILDIDFFKRVNDLAGFVEGDRLLAATATALRKSVRPDDFLARLGGDEFGLLLANVDDQAAAGIVERVRAGPRRSSIATCPHPAERRLRRVRSAGRARSGGAGRGGRRGAARSETAGARSAIAAPSGSAQN